MKLKFNLKKQKEKDIGVVMKNEKEIIVSMVIPVYNEEESINICYKAVSEELQKLNKTYEIIFVNDGSSDNSTSILEELAKSDENVKVINFSRNFGQQAALFAGFKMSSGKVVINLDCDLQDPVSLISDFLQKWEEGYDIVLAKRRSRKGETFFKKITSKLFYRFFRWLSGTKLPLDCGIARLLSKRVVETLLQMPEHNKYLHGLTEIVGFKSTVIDFDRDERKFGKTKYSVKSMCRLALNSILPFSAKPLMFILGFGIFLTFASSVMLLTQIILAICGIAVTSILWLIAVNILLSGIVTSCIGVLSLYVSRIYTESLNRPLYIISTTYNFGEESDD